MIIDATAAARPIDPTQAHEWLNASALLSRTNGVTTASGGRDSEDYVASDSTGYCYHQKLVAAQGWVTSDQLLRSC